MRSSLKDNIRELRQLCDQFFVKRLEVFGSAAKESASLAETGDLDFLVEFLPLKEGEYADSYFGLLFALEDLFGKPVDLVMVEAIRNPYFLESVERSRKLLYAA